MPENSFSFDQAVQGVRDGGSEHEAADKLLSLLTQDERLQLLDGDTNFWSGMLLMGAGSYHTYICVHGAIDRLGIPGIRFTDGPRGIVLGNSTAFPVAMARGATWDTALEEQVGRAMGLEGRAQGANFYAGVCINLPRHPAWGRVQETYGDDPILLGEMGAAVTRGSQENLMTCVKHFALNSMENARFKVDVQVDEAALHEVYLPHFQRVVKEGVTAVMSAYNSVNGEWAGQNKTLLTDILREQWGFQGFVMSDFVFGHRNPVRSVQNGLDIEAPFRQQRLRDLPGALDRGDLAWSDVDRSGKRILARTIKHYAERNGPEPDKSVVFSQEHRDLAHSVASRAMVLLKNEETENGKPLLPVDPFQFSKCAVLGRLANTANTGDRGSSMVRSPEVITPYQGIQHAFSAHGIEVCLSDSDDVEEAKNLAATADFVILMVGYTHEDEGESMIPVFGKDTKVQDFFPPFDGSEGANKIAAQLQGAASYQNAGQGLNKSGFGTGGDRKSLRLRSKDVEMINEVSKVNKHLIVSVVAAGAVIMEDWREKVPAILLSWYSGCEGGTALADVMLGCMDASGRLPYSIPTSEDHLPFFDAEASSIRYDRWHGQRLIDRLGQEAAFPLGFGLSYTTFAFSDLVVRPPEGYGLDVKLNVANTGLRNGRCIVQVYGKLPEISKDEFPSRLLLGFTAVDLDSNASKEVHIQASTKPLHRYQDGRFKYASANILIEVGGFCGDEKALVTRLNVE